MNRVLPTASLRVKNLITMLQMKGLKEEEIIKEIEHYCPMCQADKSVWNEVFNEQHRCY